MTLCFSFSFSFSPVPSSGLLAEFCRCEPQHSLEHPAEVLRRLIPYRKGDFIPFLVRGNHQPPGLFHPQGRHIIPEVGFHITFENITQVSCAEMNLLGNILNFQRRITVILLDVAGNPRDDVLISGLRELLQKATESSMYRCSRSSFCCPLSPWNTISGLKS